MTLECTDSYTTIQNDHGFQSPAELTPFHSEGLDRRSLDDLSSSDNRRTFMPELEADMMDPGTALTLTSVTKHPGQR